MSELEKLYQMPGHLIRRVQQIAVSIFNDECVDSGLTAVQYAALVAIDERGPLDATRLAALISFDRSTIGSVLERLEGKALISRTPDLRDRRLKLLVLTAKGRKILRRVEPSVIDAQTRILERLDPDERTLFLTLLRKFVHIEEEEIEVPKLSDKTIKAAQ